MADRPANIVIVGCISMAAGGVYALQGLGVIPSPQFKPGTDKAMLALCVGAAFLCAGPAAMLTLVRAPLARTAINVLTLVIVVCMASIGAWVALNAEPGRISGPLALVSPKLNDLTGHRVRPRVAGLRRDRDRHPA